MVLFGLFSFLAVLVHNPPLEKKEFSSSPHPPGLPSPLTSEMSIEGLRATSSDVQTQATTLLWRYPFLFIGWVGGFLVFFGVWGVY